jgi:hypothetical protein
MIALLIGRELGEETLSGRDPDERLVDVLPQLPSGPRLNQTVGEVRVVLGDAERQMAYMSIPYVLSIHHRFLGDALELLERDGVSLTGNPHEIDLADAHGDIAEACGAELPAAELLAFEFARHIRNRLTHHRGLAGPKLRAEWLASRGKVPEADGQALWTELALRPFPLVRSRDELELGSGELFAVLGITKRLADAVQGALVDTLSPRLLADIVVADYRARYPDRFRQTDRRDRRILGFCRGDYPYLSAVSPEDLREATAALRQGGGST